MCESALILFFGITVLTESTWRRLVLIIRWAGPQNGGRKEIYLEFCLEEPLELIQYAWVTQFSFPILHLFSLSLSLSLSLSSIHLLVFFFFVFTLTLLLSFKISYHISFHISYSAYKRSARWIFYKLLVSTPTCSQHSMAFNCFKSSGYFIASRLKI